MLRDPTFLVLTALALLFLILSLSSNPASMSFQ